MSKELHSVKNNEVGLTQDWQKKLAEYAQQSKKFAEDSGGIGGRFFSTKGGKLKWCGTPVDHNTFVCIILTQCYEYSYYEKEYIPEDISPPECFALSEDKDELKPHENSEKPQAEKCNACTQNDWGTGKGKAKACSNSLRLALLPAGAYVPKENPRITTDAELFKEDEIGYLRIPPTSNKNYTRYVKMLNAQGLPPFAMYSLISLVDDEKTRFQINFKSIKPIEDMKILEALEQRVTQAKDEILFPYDVSTPTPSTTVTKEKVEANKNLKY